MWAAWRPPISDGDEVYILPAVAGGSVELTERDLQRYSRQVALEDIGYGGQLRLRTATICVVGTGGLGNPITRTLAGMGVGKLRIVDRGHNRIYQPAPPDNVHRG